MNFSYFKIDNSIITGTTGSQLEYFIVVRWKRIKKNICKNTLIGFAAR